MTVLIISQIDGMPCSATTMVGTVVTSSSSMIRGLVSATYPATRVRSGDLAGFNTAPTLSLGGRLERVRWTRSGTGPGIGLGSRGRAARTLGGC